MEPLFPRISTGRRSQDSDCHSTPALDPTSCMTLGYGSDLQPREWGQIEARLRDRLHEKLASRFPNCGCDILRRQCLAHELLETSFNQLLDRVSRDQLARLKDYGLLFLELSVTIPQEINNREIAFSDEYWSRRSVRAEHTHGCVTINSPYSCASCKFKNLRDRIMTWHWKVRIEASIASDRVRLDNGRKEFHFLLGCELHPFLHLAQRFIPMDLWADAADSMMNGRRPQDWNSLRRPVDTSEAFPLYEDYRLPLFENEASPPYSEI